MLRRPKTLNYLEEKPKKLAFVRMVLILTTTIVLVLGLTGVVVFSCVHGTHIP